MREIFYLTKRNCLIFLRERSSVFFSVLSMLIVLALMVIFLGRTNSEDLVNILAEYGGERNRLQDQENAAYLIQLWTLGGILAVNAVTVTLTVIGAMVRDETQKRAAAFYVTPVSRLKLALGYILSAWLVGMGMCLFTLVVAEGYFMLQGHEPLAIVSLLELGAMIALNTFVFAAMGFLLALFVHSSNAWGSLLTIVGTLVGFAGGIYVPLTAMSERLQMVLKCLPVLPAASMMRRVCTEEAIRETFTGLPEGAGNVFRERMGITLFVSGEEITTGWQIAFILLYAVLAIGAAAVLNRRRKLS